MPKFRAVVVGLTASALLVPASAEAKRSKSRAKSAKAAPLVVLKAQVLQPNCGSGILGTEGTIVLGAPVRVCI